MSTKENKGCVTFVALPFTLKKYLKATEELWKHSNIFHHAKIQSSKNPLEETKILQDIIITL
jgi:hypothetical protein